MSSQILVSVYLHPPLVHYGGKGIWKGRPGAAVGARALQRYILDRLPELEEQPASFLA